MKIGDKFKIPDCGHTGEIIGLSGDGKTAYVKCHKEHEVDPLTKKPYGKNIVYRRGEQTKVTIKRRDIVYMIDVSDTVR
jgi:hypothetical protein